MGQHDRCQPTGLREGYKPAFSRDVARQIPDQFEERRVVKRGGKRHPLRLLDVIGKVQGMPELGALGRDLLPKNPGTAIGFPE